MKRASSYINNETNDPAASNARLVPATRLTAPVFLVEIGMTGPVLVEAVLELPEAGVVGVELTTV